MGSSHGNQTESEGIHQPFNWVWADETERTAESVLAADINKVGLQQDTNSIYVLTAVTPTWTLLASGDASALIEPGDGANSIILNGSGGASDGEISLSFGEDCAGTGKGAVALGLEAEANGDYAFAHGNAPAADGDYSYAHGFDTFASENFARATGDSSSTYATGQISHSAGIFSDQADSQFSDFHIRAVVTHSDANWYPLFPNGADDFMLIPSDGVWTFDALIVGTTANLGKVFSFRIVGCVKNSAGTTALSGVPTVTTISDGDDVSFDARAVANDTEDSLDIEVSDSDGSSDIVRWTAVVRVAQVSFE